MKRFFLMLGMSMLLFSFVVQSDVDELIKAFKTANSEQVSNHFNNLIDLVLPGKEEIKNMGKNQASIALKFFFEENGIKGMDILSQREAGSAMYLAGKMVGKNKSYNVTVWLNEKEGKHFISTLRINTAQ
jgi:hypothetical protein